MKLKVVPPAKPHVLWLDLITGTLQAAPVAPEVPESADVIMWYLPLNRDAHETMKAAEPFAQIILDYDDNLHNPLPDNVKLNVYEVAVEAISNLCTERE